MIALVGSRDLCEENARFATELGAQVAKQGYTLVSGNARGADSTAQEACLAAGGQVVSIVSDPLMVHRTRENVLYVSENGFDEPFPRNARSVAIAASMRSEKRRSLPKLRRAVAGHGTEV